ncbi:MAG: hypothetical protein ACYS7Y_06955 [Planctomycetota bacterium]
MPEEIRAELLNSDFRVTELGQTLPQSTLQFQCKSVFGGVAFPDKRPGFAVVVAMANEKRGDNRDFALLDEFESMSMREIVRQCGVLDMKYTPAMWIGDDKNDGADRFIDEMNEDLKSADGYKEHRHFSLTSTSLLDMEQPYPYFLDTFKELLNTERRQLFLKGSRVVSYLAEVETGDVAELTWGTYPAIEALAFAVIEMRDRNGKGFLTKEEWRALKKEYGHDDGWFL